MQDALALGGAATRTKISFPQRTPWMKDAASGPVPRLSIQQQQPLLRLRPVRVELLVPLALFVDARPVIMPFRRHSRVGRNVNTSPSH
jgi:hypothetical protein